MSIIPALGRLRQEDHQEFEASLDYISRPWLNNNKIEAMCKKLTGRIIVNRKN